MRLDELRTHLSGAESSIHIISPYMTPGTLQKILAEIPSNINVVVVCSWRKEDVAQGFANPEIFTICQENNWTLRVDIGEGNRVHLKAYIIDTWRAMIGSANLTGAGMGSNIESLLHVDQNHPDWPQLFLSIQDVKSNTRNADEELYHYVLQYADNSKKVEENKPLLPEWSPPPKAKGYKFDLLERQYLESLKREILDEMPQPRLRELFEVESIDRALHKRGLQFTKIKNIIRSTRRGGPGWDNSNELLNRLTNQIMQEMVQSNDELDIQKRYTSNCLVWKIHHILNEEIRRHVKPYIGKPLRDLGLDESLWDSGTRGNKVQHARDLCLGLLPEELRNAIMRLKTHSGTLRLKIDGRALYPRKFGESLVFTDQEGQFLNLSPEQMLPEKKFRNQLWFPLFCIFEAPKKIKLGDFRLMGLGLWESNFNFVQDLEADLEDITRVLSEQAEPFHDNPFKEGIPRRVIHTKVADKGHTSHLPYGHPNRKMSRYVNLASLTDIAQEILSHDH